MTNAKWTLALVRGAVLVLGVVASYPSSAQTATYRLVRRTAGAADRQEFQAAEAMGFDAYLTAQLDPSTLPDVEAEVDANWPLVNESPYFILTNYGLNVNTRSQPKRQMRYARAWRWMHSDQGLYERMTWFWANHLSIDQNKDNGWALFPWFDRFVSRKHALGTFRELIHASAGDSVDRAAAMLEYLDNVANRCVPPNGIPNENYAREFFELHVLGKGPQVHTEDDVEDLATIFSGWGKVTDQSNIRWGLFDFNGANHCEGSYTFYGVNIPPDDVDPTEGQLAIDALIDYVDPTDGPICPQFIARKLVAGFLTDAPAPPGSPEEAILQGAVADAVAAFGSDGDISAMLDAILTQSNIDGIFNGANPLPKYMPPWLFVSSLLRAAEANVDPANIRAVTMELDQLGQSPYDFGPPVGYPESIGAWVQDQPGRWNFAYKLFEDSILGIPVNVSALYAQIGGFDRATAADQASLILTGGNLAAEDLQIIQRYADLSPLPDAEMMWKVLALAAISPSYSLY